MATPRVFVSSTCFDLDEVRDTLVDFIKLYSYEPVLSDKGDVFYSPDLHTHDACLREVENCQLFILIIGGRFGGEYHDDPNRKTPDAKSIVNLEYDIARKNNIPVFTFVKRDVLENHKLYQDNLKHRSEADAKTIFYSAIDKDKQHYAEQIFKFIDEVRHASVNNGFFRFDYAREIQDLLKKQWAGMVYEFLSERKRLSEVNTTNRLIENLTIATQKTEELIKSLVKQQVPDAQNVIDHADKAANAKRFYAQIVDFFKVDVTNDFIEKLKKISRDVLWYQYLVNSDDFEILENYELKNGKRVVLALGYKPSRIMLTLDGETQPKKSKAKVSELESLFNSVKELSSDLYIDVLDSLITT